MNKGSYENSALECSAVMKPLLEPTNLYCRSMVFSEPCLVPEEMGLYAWYCKEIPGITPTDGCVVKDDRTLLYVGRTGNLRERVRYTFEGNAEGSTFRKSLGVLLAEKSGFPLRRVGSGKRMAFTHLGESWLNDWMEQNAFVCWMTHSEPRKVKQCIINSVSLPLNIQNNRHHRFYNTLSKMRQEAERMAIQMLIVE